MSQVPDTNNWSAEDQEFAELVDDLTRRLQAGESLDEAKLLSEFPAYAIKLRELLPSLKLLQCANDSDDQMVDAADEDFDPTPKTLGDFQLVRELGRGGMGVVYEARQISLDIPVALKILPFAAMLNSRALARFEIEARAAARLQHPHVVSVHAVGFDRGTHFYAMRYVEGTDLSKLITELQSITNVSDVEDERNAAQFQLETARLSNTDASRGVPSGSTAGELFGLSGKSRSPKSHYFEMVARLGIQMANGLQHAHDMGIVHRDIKPSNVMIDRTGNALITDFGLAQVKGNVGVTITGELVGTYRYMSPEQIHAKHIVVDNRSDVYSLGVTLYELLTLHRPFDAENKAALLSKIAFEDPQRPTKINPRIPIDLERVVAKAMEKDPKERYQSASEVATDLQCFLRRQPLEIATRPSFAKRLKKWAARRRSFVASLGVILTVVFFASLVSLAAIAVAYQRQQTLYETEKQLHSRAARLWRKSDGLRLAAHSALELSQDPGLAFGLAVQGYRLHPNKDLRNALLNADAQNHEHRTLVGHGAELGSVSFDAAGEKLVTTVARTRFSQAVEPARVWTVSTGDLLVELQSTNAPLTSAVFSPAGVRILASSAPIEYQSGDVDGSDPRHFPTIWDSLSGQKQVTLKGGFLFAAHPRCFNANGRRVVTPAANNNAGIWDVLEDHDAELLEGHEGRVTFAAFNVSGEQVVTISDDKTVRIWDAQTRETLRVLDAWKDAVGDRPIHAVFGPRGEWLATVSKLAGIDIWDLATGEKVNAEPWPGVAPHFAPHGRQLIYQRYQTTRIRGIDDGKVAFEFPGRLLAVSADGGQVAIHNGPQASVWSTKTGARIGDLHGHRSGITHASFRPDGQYLATASYDSTARLWHPRSGLQRRRFAAALASNTKPLFAENADGSQVAIATAGRISTYVIDPKNDQRLHRFPGARWHDDSRAGRLLTTEDHSARVWDIETGEEIAAFYEPQLLIREGHLGFDGKFALVATEAGPAWLWRWETNERIQLVGHQDDILEMDVSPSGKAVATASEDGTARIWDAVTGRLLQTLPHSHPVGFVRFSQDGKSLATTTDFQEASLWDVASGEKQTDLVGAEGFPFNRIEFSATGDRVFGYRETRAEGVLCWQTETGELVGKYAPFRGRQRVVTQSGSPYAGIASSVDGAILWDGGDAEPRRLTKAPCYSVFFAGPEQAITSTRPLGQDPRLVEPGQRQQFRSPSIETWSVDSGERLSTLASAAGVATWHRDPDNEDKSRVIVTGQEFGVGIFGVANREQLAEIWGHSAPLAFVGFARDLLVTASWDETVAVWDSATGDLKRRTKGRSAITSATIAPDATAIAWGDAGGGVATWDLIGTAAPRQLKGHQDLVSIVRFHPAGKQLISASLDNTTKTHNLRESVTQTVEGEELSARQIRFSADGKRWMLIPGVPVRKFTSALSLESLKPPAINWVRLHGVADNASLKLNLESTPVNAFFRNQDKEIITFTREQIAVWDSQTRTLVHKSRVAGKDLRGATLSRDGRFAVLQLTDEIVLWDVEQKQEILRFSSPNQSPMENGRISPEGAGVYMTYEGFLLYRPTDVEQLLRQAPRGLTNLERRSFEIVDEKDWP